MLVLKSIRGMFARFAASPMALAAAMMGPDWLNEVEGRLTKTLSAFWRTESIACTSVKSAARVSTDLLSTSRGFGLRLMAITEWPARASTFT